MLAVNLMGEWVGKVSDFVCTPISPAQAAFDTRDEPSMPGEMVFI